MQSGYRYLAQTADARIYAWASDFPGILLQMTLALINIMYDVNKIKSNKTMQIAIKGDSEEEMLYEILNELLFTIEINRFLPCKIEKITIEKSSLKATLRGDTLKNYILDAEVKAITYHEFYVRQKQDDSFEAQVVIDL